VQRDEEWVYRLRDYAPSERVRIIEIHQKATSARVDIEFVEDGHIENVPAKRLRRPWSEVIEFDALMANWERFEASELSVTEEAAIEAVYEILIPPAIATWDWSPVRYASSLYDRAELARLADLELDDLIGDVASFELEGVLMLSPEGSLRVAEAICRAHPAEVVAWIMAEEAKIRELCKRGRSYKGIDGEERETSPEWEYSYYLKRDKPLHELLRQWCGYRAVTFHERLAAAEAEVRRLDVLVAQVIDYLRERDDKIYADVVEEEHERYRVTPERVRPVADRPLRPDEIPVIEVPARRRWGYSS
jgi:hypothetical protein